MESSIATCEACGREVEYDASKSHIPHKWNTRRYLKKNFLLCGSCDPQPGDSLSPSTRIILNEKMKINEC